MADRAPQTFANHPRYVPLYHYVAVPILLINFVNAAVVLIKQPEWRTILGLLVAFALVVVAVCARTFANTVQDRVIRSEERERLLRLLPAELQHRVTDLDHRQLVALRFASDAELPSLARTVLEQGIAEPKTIKQMVTTWRADHLRA
ncbi:MAG TPA: DUF6526 family protein [Gemmatimonadales bacterium]|jgi:hypothetical protein|nr:DUF6526 family protein [Gemmatimonadales bacterium]